MKILGPFLMIMTFFFLVSMQRAAQAVTYHEVCITTQLVGGKLPVYQSTCSYHAEKEDSQYRAKHRLDHHLAVIRHDQKIKGLGKIMGED